MILLFQTLVMSTLCGALPFCQQGIRFVSLFSGMEFPGTAIALNLLMKNNGLKCWNQIYLLIIFESNMRFFKT